MTSLFEQYNLIQQSDLFDADFYLKSYPDIVELGLDPLTHYLETGWSEGRDPSAAFHSHFYREQCGKLGLPVENPLLHFVLHGQSMGLETFDPEAAPHDAASEHATAAKNALKGKKSKVAALSGDIYKVELGNGFLYVEGSVQEDLDTANKTELFLVVSSEGREIGRRAITGLVEKPNTNKSADGLTRRHFALALPLDTTLSSEISFALARKKVLVPIGASSFKPEIFKPLGQIEGCDAKGIYGWVFDPGIAVSKRKPTLLIDGKLELEITLQESRSDLQFRDCTSDEPNFGFRLSLNDLVKLSRGVDFSFTLFRASGHSVVLVSSNTQVDSFALNLRQQNNNGRLEKCDANGATGWAAVSGNPDAYATIDLYVDGVRYHTMSATQYRRDLKLKGVTNAGGGFRFELPTVMANANPVQVVSARYAHSDVELTGSPQEIKVPRKSKDRRGILEHLGKGQAPVTILIPIYNAAKDVALCLESVLKNTTAPARLLLIDDASPDPEIGKILSRYKGWKNIEIHKNPQNLGFTKTVNKGIKLAGNDDVIFLNSDTIVPPGWLEGLRLAAYSKSGVATATAVSTNSGAFNVHETGVENIIPSWMEVEDFARLVRRASVSSYPSVPTGNGFCMYVRRTAIDAIGPLDEEAFPRGYGEENDFCMRAVRAGFTHVVDDRTFVYHKRSASFGDQKTALMDAGSDTVRARYPEYRLLTPIFSEDPDLLTMRWRVRHAIKQASKLGTVLRPRVLFVISTVTGGTPQTNRDLMEALADRYEPWILRCDSRMIELSRHEPAGDVVMETHRLDKVIHASLHRSPEYDAQVADVLLRYGFETVHIRHIAWHGLGLIDVCKKLGVPVIFSFHDFYTICPTIKLLDENQVFCGGKCTKTPGHCDAELWPKNSLPELKNGYIHRWRELMSAALSQCDAFVTTSPGAHELMLANYPVIVGKEFRVIPHGRTFTQMSSLANRSLSGSTPLRILVPGNISAAKGAAFFEAVADLDLFGEFEFHILGDSGSLVPRRNLVIHGKYERHEFAARVQNIRPHIGAVLSIWPETYCHTLTEMWSCGLPVLAFEMGAVGERIREHGGGWLVDRWITPEALVEYLLELKRNSADISRKVTDTWSWQESYGRYYDTKAMAVEYDLLYRDVLARRRPFTQTSAESVSDAKTVLVVSARDAASGKAPASTHIRLLERIRNRTSRPVIFREVAADYPFDQAGCGRADAVLIQRNVIKPSAIPTLISQCKTAKLPIIIDMDDDLLNVPADKDPDRRYATGAEPLRKLIGASSLLMVSTTPLMERMKTIAPKVALVPNMLSARLWQSDSAPEASIAGLPERGSKLRVLYMGTVTHDDDLEMIREAIVPLVDVGVCEFHIIGGQSKDAPWFKRIPLPNECKNYPEFVAWFRTVAKSFDVAIAPLRDSEFNACKSDLKFLDYSAADLPVLLSEVASYASAAEGGAVLVANTADDWQRAILSMKEPEARARLVRKTRSHVGSSRVMRTGSEGFDALLLSAIKKTG